MTNQAAKGHLRSQEPHAPGLCRKFAFEPFVLWCLSVIYGAQTGRTTMAISGKGAHVPQEIMLLGVRWYVA